ncbi:ABC transporter ATP-binding protein [Clostridium sp. HMP27]|uniref:ABC transporter ATP-binding protein n=1 Tax=Clostridium sp. HMP27 TaxID=1487921 RepID=UPI00052BF11F|nr:ABC transporter ATP-binding protein [Clostridium sp. HMP27]KGK86707.1 spermidine/putrescine ABC transporter ATP-binding protein [Clostridium sp. HMP27]
MDKVVVKDIYMNYHSLSNSTMAINNISFTVKDGEFLSIVGPSGCGKSTVLNIIAGLLKPSSGEIFIDGEKVDKVSSKVGYMFQRDHLFDWLTVLDNITLGLKIQHNLTEERKTKIDQLLKDYNLWDFKNHYPKELSGGMRQRAALIRTLALTPEVLLLDEPFSALDYQTRLNVSDDIYNILKKEGKTIIMVTHDLSEAISMSDRVIVLSNRPAEIKRELEISFSGLECKSPLKCREASNFRVYFNELWKELNS